MGSCSSRVLVCAIVLFFLITSLLLTPRSGGPLGLSATRVIAQCAVPDASPPATQVRLLAANLTQPIYLTHAGDNTGRLFIVEQGGTIRIFKSGKGGGLLPTPFLNISNKVISGGEQGLLSVAFHPSYSTNGRFFVNYTAPGGGPAGKSVIAEYRVSSNPDIADPMSERVILEIPDPFSNHNGGLNKFGPDGMLYIGLGDAGGGGDPQNNGQSLGTLFGKILRIRVDGALPYEVPLDNPFVGTPGARGEIWAYGLRNPWRFSFDRCDGRFFLGDVGQNLYEEIDLIVKGGNFGWRVMEGNHCFNPPAGCDMAGKILPIAEYDHSLGCSVTGGYVYRGARFADLAGRYIFGDYCTGRIWALWEAAPTSWTMAQLTQTSLNISSFGEDQAGELYVVNHNGEIYQLFAGSKR